MSPSSTTLFKQQSVWAKNCLFVFFCFWVWQEIKWSEEKRRQLPYMLMPLNQPTFMFVGRITPTPAHRASTKDAAVITLHAHLGSAGPQGLLFVCFGCIKYHPQADYAGYSTCFWIKISPRGGEWTPTRPQPSGLWVEPPPPPHPAHSDNTVIKYVDNIMFQDSSPQSGLLLHQNLHHNTKTSGFRAYTLRRPKIFCLFFRWNK